MNTQELSQVFLYRNTQQNHSMDMLNETMSQSVQRDFPAPLEHFFTCCKCGAQFLTARTCCRKCHSVTNVFAEEVWPLLFWMPNPLAELKGFGEGRYCTHVWEQSTKHNQQLLVNSLHHVKKPKLENSKEKYC